VQQANSQHSLPSLGSRPAGQAQAHSTHIHTHIEVQAYSNKKTIGQVQSKASFARHPGFQAFCSSKPETIFAN